MKKGEGGRRVRGITDERKGDGVTVWWRQWSGSGGEGVWWRVEAQEAPERLRIARSIDCRGATI